VGFEPIRPTKSVLIRLVTRPDRQAKLPRTRRKPRPGPQQAAAQSASENAARQAQEQVIGALMRRAMSDASQYAMDQAAREARSRNPGAGTSGRGLRILRRVRRTSRGVVRGRSHRRQEGTSVKNPFRLRCVPRRRGVDALVHSAARAGPLPRAPCARQDSTKTWEYPFVIDAWWR
jgi:hypothetical protein